MWLRQWFGVYIFKTCPHPDHKQRSDIGKRLGLESNQVKFWFQNRRTQMKSQLERQENLVLKHEHDKIIAENIAMKEALNNLMVENARLKDELSRVCGVTESMLGKPISDIVGSISIGNLKSDLEQSKGKGVLNDLMSSPTPLPMGFNLDHGAPSNSIMTTSINGAVSTGLEKTMYIHVAMAGMNELLAMAQSDSPLWCKGNGKDLLNHDEYVKNFSGGVMGAKPWGFITDASRETSTVFITGLELMETMMIPGQWKELFPCMISNAATIEVLCSGADGTRDGELQLMNVEFVFPSPFVPFRKGKILRFCKKQSEGMWALVDVSLDMNQETSFSGASIKWRRLPSGCVIQDIGNGYSWITWIEHLQYDENCVPPLYQPLMKSGMAFGAQRWLATLLRECEFAAVFMSARIYPDDDATVGFVTQDGRKSVLKLTRRITSTFCSGLDSSSNCFWQKLQVGELAVDVCVASRVSTDKPGEPSGVVLSASSSIWIPVPRQRLFAFLCNEKIRGIWDILANGGPMEVIARFSKSHDGSNSVSLLCPPAVPARERNMLIVQDSWSDRTGSFVVYAPVDASSMEAVLKGGDSEYLSLLPSGFTIVDALVQSDIVTLDSGNNGGASALTIGFQIHVNTNTSTILGVESINSITHLITSTLQKIIQSIGVN